MATYRTGGHWGITIVREGVQPPDERGRHADDELVAVTMNDPALAAQICALLNGRNDLQAAQDALVANRNLWQRRALDAGWKP
jgi:hypothetical protein